MARVRPGGRRGSIPSDGSGGRWIVALPAWGDRYVGVLVRHTLPALLVALRELGLPVTLLVWTDQADRLSQVLALAEGDQPVVIADPPGPDGAFESLSNCHRQALEVAGPNDRVVLLTADMVVSREVLWTAAGLCARGVELVCCVAMRAMEDAGAPVGASGRDLLTWAWAHRHRMTRECTWPEGRSYDVWRMYFERGEEVAARVFLPHPLVVMPRGRRLEFRPTIDVNLTANFSRSLTYLITQPEEGAVVELSPPDKDFLLTTTMRVRLAAGAGEPSCPPFIPCSNLRHRMFFDRRVVLCGTGGDCGDAEVVGKILG